MQNLQWAFSGISTFAHLKHIKCLTSPYEPFDIGIIGCPFDTAVTYRPGMRGEMFLRLASAAILPGIYAMDSSIALGSAISSDALFIDLPVRGSPSVYP